MSDDLIARHNAKQPCTWMIMISTKTIHHKAAMLKWECQVQKPTMPGITSPRTRYVPPPNHSQVGHSYRQPSSAHTGKILYLWNRIFIRVLPEGL